MLPKNHDMLQIGQVAEQKLKDLLIDLCGKKAQVVTESRSFVVELFEVKFRYPGVSGVEIVTPEWSMNDKMQLAFENSDGNLNDFESSFVTEFFLKLKEVLTTSDEVEFTQEGIKRIEIPIPAYACD